MFSIWVPKYLWGEAILTSTYLIYLWGEAILTSTYLINWLPSRVLKFETPFQTLIKIFPHVVLSFYIPFKIFGCSTFVHVYPQNKSKLDPRSIKCVFIGYFANKKGYKCLCPNTWRVFETMDLTFFFQT